MLRLYLLKILVGLRLALVFVWFLNSAQRKALRGKIRRFIFAHFNKKKAQFFISQRKGLCNRCGNCCYIGFKCPAYDEKNKACRIQKIKPLVCDMFPLTPLDLSDRDFLSSIPKCGFYWNKTESEISKDYKNS